MSTLPKWHKAFGKRPIDWLRLPSTETFIAELEAVRFSHRSVLIQTENSVGTWMHEDVAIEFARWLSPSFAIWCNNRIKELFTTGRTDVRQQSEDEAIMLGYSLLIGKVEKLTATIEQQAPKVAYYEEVLQSETLITTTIIAKELGMSAAVLNRILSEKRIIYQSGETYVLYARYQGKGYTGTVTVPYTDRNTGKEYSLIQMKWTEAGRAFIHQIFGEVSKNV